MRGNAHAESVLEGIANIERMIGKRELYQRDGMGIIVEAESRLAIAHEQRTTNLINFLGTIPVDDVRYTQLLLDIQNRMGMGHELD